MSLKAPTRTTKMAVLALTTFSLLTVISAPAHAELLTFFDFNDNNYVSDGGLRSSTITNNFNAGDIGFVSGTTVNADPDDAGPQPASAAGRGVQVYNTNSIGVSYNGGRFIQFGLNTTGFENIILDFATRRSIGGFDSNQFQYSTNGTTFQDLGAAYNPPTSDGLVTYNLSSITGLNNNPNTAYRIVFNGGLTTDPDAFNSIDNIAVNAVVATPEPGTMSLMGIGLASLVAARRRKKNEANSDEEAA